MYVDKHPMKATSSKRWRLNSRRNGSSTMMKSSSSESPGIRKNSCRNYRGRSIPSNCHLINWRSSTTRSSRSTPMSWYMRLFSMSFGGSASSLRWCVRVPCLSNTAMRASGTAENCSFKTLAIFTRRQGMTSWQICLPLSSINKKARRLTDKIRPTPNYIRIFKPRLNASTVCWSTKSIDRRTNSRTYSSSKKEIPGISFSTKNQLLVATSETTASQDSERLICW